MGKAATTTTTPEKTSLLRNKKESGDEENAALYTPETSHTWATSHSSSHSSSSSCSDDDDIMGEIGVSTSSKTVLKVYIMAGCAALNSCNLGFDVGVNTDAGLMIQQGMSLSDVKLEAFMGSLSLFAMVGALSSSTFISHCGLRWTFVIASISFIVGIAIMLCSTTYAPLMLGRFFVGLGVGIGFAVTPVYISEISPRSKRGFLVSWSEIGCNVGIVLGFMAGFTSYSLPPDFAWRLMFSIGFVMPTVLIGLAMFVMVESPRWLILKGREREARRVLCSLHPKEYNVDAALTTIKDSIEEERNLATHENVGWSTILCPPTPALKRMIFVGFGTAISHQLCGIDAIQYYLSFILEEAGIDDRLHQTQILTLLGLLKLSCLFIAGPMSDRLGRRPLLFISLSGTTCALILIAWDTMMSEHNQHNHNPIVTILGLAAYLSFFSLGLGPLGWIIPSEIFSTSIRSKAISISTLLNRVTGTVVISSMITLADLLSWTGYFALLAGINLCILLFFYLYLPETKGRALEEMLDYFESITATSQLR